MSRSCSASSRALRGGQRATLRAVLVIVLGLLCMAPTAGDVGGCGTEVTTLDPLTFALTRKELDCARCEECGIESARCRRSCDPEAEVETQLPSTCYPLLHDGRVCIRALYAASCSAYRAYVDDTSPSTPSECQFCKIAPQAMSTFSGDLGRGGS